MNDSKKLNETISDATAASNIEDVNVSTETKEVNNSRETNLQEENKDVNNAEAESSHDEQGANVSNDKVVTKEEEVKKDVDDMDLTFINRDFVLDTMSVPTDSHNEFRMVVYIIQFAKRNGIEYEFDDYGNIYLTKGKLEDGEYYPCVTSHLDTVQHKQEPYIRAGVGLDLKIEKTKDGEHKLSVDTKGQS